MADKKNEAPDDLLANLGIALPPAIGESNARQPLGPPQGYYSDVQAMDPAKAGFQPYINGDEWMPATYNVEDRDRLKARMNGAGLYGTTGYQSGSWTREDANAYQQVLEAANATLVRDDNVVIDNIAQEVKKGPRVAGPRAPLVNVISDPESIRQIVRKSAFDLIGQRLNPDEEERIINAYRSYQSGANQAEYAAGVSGGQVNQPMSAQDFAEGQIESTRTGEVQAERGMDFLDGLMQSVGSTQIQGPATYTGKGLPTPGQEVV